MITAHHLVFGKKATAKNKGLILDLPLQNNFTDTTGINTMRAGGSSNLPTFTLDGGEYAATFNGSQSLKTNSNFLINSDKISVSFWVKTSQTNVAIIAELSSNSDNTNAFYVALNNAIVNHLSLRDRIDSNYNFSTSPHNIGDWNHIVCIIDRSLPIANECYIYVNKILSSTVFVTSGEVNGNFGLFPLFIGQRAGSSLGFNGQMKFLKIFNYPLSPSEITNLYNKTM